MFAYDIASSVKKTAAQGVDLVSVIEEEFTMPQQHTVLGIPVLQRLIQFIDPVRKQAAICPGQQAVQLTV